MQTENAPVAVVTGVSTGIGRAIAESLIEAGWIVYGSVRKEADAKAAREALGEAYRPLIFDVTDDEGVKAAAEKVRGELGGKTLSALVNNAGVAVAGPIQYLNLDDLKRQLDINLYGPIRVTQNFAPLLGVDRTLKGAPGRVVNMSSVAGKIASPYMGPYSMSKHALEAMSEALRRELLVHGVDVVIVGPGAVKTPIWAKADDLDVDQFRETEHYETLIGMKKMMQDYGDTGVDAREVGDLVRRILTIAKPKTRYAILNSKFMNWTLPNILPKRIVDGFVAKRFGITPRTS